MAAADEWLELAIASAEAGSMIETRDIRSATSRFYFAAYQAAHAVALHAGLEAPARGNWSHQRIPLVLAGAVEGQLKRSPLAADLLRRRMASAQRARVFGDYVAERGRFDVRTMEAARAAAVSLVRLARGLVR